MGKKISKTPDWIDWAEYILAQEEYYYNSFGLYDDEGWRGVYDDDEEKEG